MIPQVENHWKEIIRGGYITEEDRSELEKRLGELGGLLSAKMELGDMPSLEGLQALSMLGKEKPGPAWNLWFTAGQEVSWAYRTLGIEAWEHFSRALDCAIRAINLG